MHGIRAKEKDKKQVGGCGYSDSRRHNHCTFTVYLQKLNFKHIHNSKQTHSKFLLSLDKIPVECVCVPISHMGWGEL